ncbi:serine--tRNA ligase [Candidatus Nanoperiomorbus periodonticus]|uniref:serine--tRNA ligase n=1 Tax=Candidatus Nanoperiomorbus periodonticus TaxID=2171989 RepID=UPI001F4EDBDD|nr:serine--tRNA ligase [Candidatus Nanoperiomorbus periodonticus]RYC75689.1 Serine--tRNA ligase [Candidatus Nanoperiomorbus periodonticus]
MLTIKYIRDHAELVQRSADAKGYQVDVAETLSLDRESRELGKQIDDLRAQRNSVAAQMKNGKPAPELIKQGKELKAQLAELEERHKALTAKLTAGIDRLPNIIFDDVPLGGEEDSVTVREWGEPKSSGVDHLDYATDRGWVDFERGAKVAGAKFYYLKNELALLENALVQYGLAKVIAKGFTYMTVPHMVKGRVFAGTGFAPRTSDQSDEYFIEREDLGLIATAEMSITGYHMDEILDEKDLPLLYAGYSPCYRKEAGAAGKHTRGLFRVHQFNKLEMYAFCLPEQSQQIHQQILGVEEEIWQELDIPYRVINIAAGDLGAPAAKKYDIEFWSPHDRTYRELTSCSNCTDFQANTVSTRVRRQDGTIESVHTLNGTCISLARTLVAIIENYAHDGGKLTVPAALRPYLADRGEL